MHTKQYFSILAMAGMLSTAVLTGCVDQDYSLDDINTDMEFQINDLALPLNIAPVKLSSLVDLDSEECIEIIDGEYALVKSGEFTSSDIRIEGIHAVATNETDPGTVINLPTVIPGIEVPVPDYTYKFNYDYAGVDDYIVSVESGKVDLTLSLCISTHFADGKVLDADFTNLKIELPKGFYGTFNGTTVIGPGDSNIVTVKNASVNAKGELRLDFHVTEFNMEATGGRIDANHNFTLKTQMGFLSGNIKNKSTRTDAAIIKINFEISKLDVESITGIIYYNVTDLETTQDITFDNLPDVLTNPQTKLSIYNPQLYLSIENPVGTSAYATTGLKITQIRDNEPITEPATLKGRLEIHKKTGFQDYCLLPYPEALKTPYSKFPNAEKLEMTNLDNVVYGEGLPKGLKVDFVDPRLDRQRVEDFVLERNDIIKGKYTLLAPLKLGQGASIYYEGNSSGWGIASDTDEMDLSQLILEADVISHLPVDVSLHVTPINSEDKVIPVEVENIHDIVAGTTTHVAIHMNGEIKDLDGMNYTAIFKSLADAQKAQALGPDSYIELKNLKLRVTGKYIVKEDSDDE